MARALMVVLLFCGCGLGPSDEDMRADRQRLADWRDDHTASPKTWAACRAICGDSAALLPTGDGREWVTCSCVPPGARVEVK